MPNSSLDRENIKNLLVELVRQPSISNTEQEITMGNKVKNILKDISYFKENPDKLFIEPLKNDPLNRNFIAALLESDDSSNKTVILMGHYDVVEVDDYGNDKDLAFRPLELTDKIINEDYDYLPELVKNDIIDGDYLFGRGVSDMKGGQAVQISILKYYAENLDELPGNILFLSVPDEETSSRGAINSVPFLNKLKRTKNLDYQVIIDSEPMVPKHPQDEKKYIYTGSAGKSVVFFYIEGIETHATNLFDGLNSNLIASKIVSSLEGNMDFKEQIDSELITAPPSCLKLRDEKKLYSAQTPKKTITYFNMPVLTVTPKETIHKLIELAQESFQEVIAKFEESRNEFYKLNNTEFTPLDMEPKVITYKELYKSAYSNEGEKLEEKIREVFDNSKDELQQQDLALKIVDEVDYYADIEGPKIVIGFLPPYYPSILNENKTEKDKKLNKIVNKLIKRYNDKYDGNMKLSKSFLGISDLSYYKLMDYVNVKEYLKPNMPDWGLDYELPLDEINELNIPVMNLGVYGKDSHKHYERLEQNFSFEILPFLLKDAITNFLD